MHELRFDDRVVVAGIEASAARTAQNSPGAVAKVPANDLSFAMDGTGAGTDFAHESVEFFPLFGRILDTGDGDTSHQFLAATRGYANLGLTAEAVQIHLGETMDGSKPQTFRTVRDFLERRNCEVVAAGAVTINWEAELRHEP